MPNQILSEAKMKMEHALSFLHEEFGKLQIGRASTTLVDSIMVDNFGALSPLKGVASITIPEPTQIAIQPWNRDQLPNIEKAINESSLGLNPSNDGTTIRIIIPPLTEDRRKDIVKLVHKYAEDARISIRNSRHEAMSSLKALEKEKLISEDELSSKEKELQNTVDEFNKKTEESSKNKEQEIMKV